ncbi:MAG: hypothetical protein K2P19_00555, partial [Kineothrix sp.]|nr:hypothetical protein [Kineothrix sp.]
PENFRTQKAAGNCSSKSAGRMHTELGNSRHPYSAPENFRTQKAAGNCSSKSAGRMHTELE